MRFSINIVQAIILLCFFLAGLVSAADVGRFWIADDPSGPRQSAMGSAGTALSGGSFGSYNPASPAFAPVPFVSVEYGRMPGGDPSKSLIESAWMFPSWFVGASLRTYSTEFAFTDERTFDLGAAQTGANQLVQAVITGGIKIGRFASGHSITLFSERIGDYTQQAFTYAPGCMVQVIPGRVMLGASLLHYARIDTALSPWHRTPGLWYRSARQDMPRYVRGGVAWTDTVLLAGMPFTVATDLVYSGVYEQFTVPLGAEVWVMPGFAVRAGVNIKHPEEIAHFGAGVRWQSVACDVDYGLSRLDVSGAAVESQWNVSLSYGLHSPLFVK
ncbi:MAG: hypothetical protein MUF22_05445 [Chitinispirillaceae bacterium]|jgi:hypothetical protein|nr:hypothetical protein [Chitinispirillaceae bacterium]